ncbi:MAG: class III extradiol ring-cleavage dioxygenase [Myxococcota bacterium]
MPTTNPKKIKRRTMMAGGLAAGVTALAAHRGCAEEENTPRRVAMSNRMPVIFVPHGGGPYSYVDMGMPPSEVDDLATYWRELPRRLPQAPSALLVISAHWEEDVPTVMTSPRPPMLYDYYNFPAAAYEIQWPAPGHPGLASRVRELLGDAGITTGENRERGFDHGTFVPLGRSFPDADIPTVQLSLKTGLDPEEHLAVGRALTPLREEGVLIIGSGMSYHNMRGFRAAEASQPARVFDAWLHATVLEPREARESALRRWEDAPMARQVHPREEHLLPLMVVAGTAQDDDSGSVPWNGTVGGKKVSAVQFG